MQRKAVLLGEPGAAAAAAVVEAARLAFVYRAAPPRQAHGVHQVLPCAPLQWVCCFPVACAQAGPCPACSLMLSNAAADVACSTLAHSHAQVSAVSSVQPLVTAGRCSTWAWARATQSQGLRWWAEEAGASRSWLSLQSGNCSGTC